VTRMTPEDEAAYALRWNVDREDLSPAVQAQYDRLKIESETRQAEPDATAAPPPVSSAGQPPPWVLFVPLAVLWAAFTFWLAIGRLITPQVSFATLRSDVGQIRLPAGYVRVASAQSGRGCAHHQCALAEFWVWRGRTARSASGACRDVDRAMSDASGGDAVLNTLPPRGAACDYGAAFGSFLRPGLGKRDVDAFVFTGPRAAGSPGGFQVELESATFYDFTPLRSPSPRAGS
jgi:hypothetical protein